VNTLQVYRTFAAEYRSLSQLLAFGQDPHVAPGSYCHTSRRDFVSPPPANIVIAWVEHFCTFIGKVIPLLDAVLRISFSFRHSLVLIILSTRQLVEVVSGGLGDTKTPFPLSRGIKSQISWLQKQEVIAGWRCSCSCFISNVVVNFISF